MVRKFFPRVVLLILIIFFLAFFGFLIYKNNTMPKISENFQIEQLETDKEEVLIGVISDTHIPERAGVLPEKVKDIFKDVDLIIHAGDFTNLETKKELEKIAPVFAVEGNMDLEETKEKLPEGISIKIYNFKIGVIHSPFPFWLGSHFNLTQEKMAQILAGKENFDILIFGHTHRPLLKELDLEEKKLLLINPGSPTVPFFSKPSIASLKITKDSFEGEIIYFEK